ncbi:single-stranded DNA-binding protein [uncultured Treponema sp.]|uniref:single-stranded DNA-binding protein n=1 Tax=uncultured Treponema sp. TaxID=162155 RepID=UPI0025F3172E|nr:single-stranded DNA-binding protein [uncultured Treponema sp.]
MNQMNQVLIEGNIVRDPIVKETPRGTKVCVVPVATNHYYRGANGEVQKDAAFFDVEAWGANFCSRVERMAKKGRGLRVVGRLKQDRWKTADGKNSSKIYIIAEHIDFQYPKTSEKTEEDAKSMAATAAAGMMAESDYEPNNEFMDGGETVF